MIARIVPLLLVLAAFALRTWVIPIESLWRDEVDTIRFAFEPLTPDDISRRFLQTGFNGPLYLALMRGWLWLAGAGDFALRFSSVLGGMLLLCAVFALARRVARDAGLKGHVTSIIALLLAAFSPVHIWYSAEGKMYSWQPFVLVFALLVLHHASAREHTRHWVLFAVCASASFYLHILSPLFVPVAVFAWLVWRKLKGTAQSPKAGLIAFGAIVIPYLPLVTWQLPSLLRGGPTGHPQYGWLTSLQSLALNWSLGLNALLPFAADARWVWFAVGVFWIAPLLVWAGFRVSAPTLPTRRFGLALLPMAAWLLFAPLALMAISVRMPLFEPRYVLWCAPALFVLMGLVLEHAIASSMRPKLAGAFAAGAFACMLAVSGLGIASQVRNTIRPDLRGAAAYVKVQLRPGDYVVYQIPYTQYSFEHYGVFAPRVIEGPFTNNRGDLNEVDAYMRSQLAGARRVWLVESEAEMWDYQGMTRGWLERVWRVSQRQEFFTVVVTLHDVR